MLKLIGETDMYYQLEEISNDVVKYNMISKEDAKALFQVINRPLKFDELKIGMWVWDFFEERYLYLYEIDRKTQDIKYKYSGFVWNGYYEENRFYRYQQLESEE